MSSHLLYEVESICTHLGILHQRALLFQGKVEDLKSAKKADNPTVHLVVDDAEKAMQVLQPLLTEQHTHEELSVRLDDREQTTEVIDRLRQAHIRIYAVTPAEVRLEDLYLQLTHEQLPT